MRILKLASPYDPFPSELAAKHDEIRIAYEWQFLDGAAQGSSVYYADPEQRPRRPAPAGAESPAAEPPGIAGLRLLNGSEHARESAR